MCIHEPEKAVSFGKHTFFVSCTGPKAMMFDPAKKSDFWAMLFHNPEEDFEKEGLLLMQNHQGCYSWALFRNLSERISKMRLHACNLSFRQADNIVKYRVLFIPDSNLSLANFSLLSQYSKPSAVEETFDKIDLVDKHLTSAKEVHIFTIGPDGKITCDEIRTADYCRAKADIINNPTNTRNMRRFCNRQYNGEGPSNLDTRICPGYVPPRTRWPPSGVSTSHISTSIPSTKKSLPKELSSSQHRQSRSPAYYLMKLAFVPTDKIEAYLHKHDLKRARKEKRPEYAVPPSYTDWMVTTLRKRASNFYCATMLRKPHTPTATSSEQLLMTPGEIVEENGEEEKPQQVCEIEHPLPSCIPVRLSLEMPRSCHLSTMPSVL